MEFHHWPLSVVFISFLFVNHIHLSNDTVTLLLNTPDDNSNPTDFNSSGNNKDSFGILQLFLDSLDRFININIVFAFDSLQFDFLWCHVVIFWYLYYLFKLMIIDNWNSIKNLINKGWTLKIFHLFLNFRHILQSFLIFLFLYWWLVDIDGLDLAIEWSAVVYFVENVLDCGVRGYLFNIFQEIFKEFIIH